ncbi:DNA-binding IclR family transcriptional regulator [Natronocella acetinitrilica]|uniref:DNA-binding IclR family transcriptional regulator n=1 Tax=Natronocella acetinitrilica TaxID=414046 RepID=A0AAE3G7M1_9GAMM|nr:IclR family transcriptional regulator [Natronocella acetinitrilica]MCP1677266.1 DNA-binding IclR family transcriptional regulator [Natronocella acetinitrilica]
MKEQDSPAKGKPDYIVPGLLRGLSILGLFGYRRPTMRLADIARELNLPRATAFRLVYTLEQEGYLLRIKESGAYSLGPLVLTLGFDYLHSQELVQIAGPLLDGLRDRTGASTHLAVLDRFDVLYIYRAASHERLSSNRHVGSRLPAHVNSIGRAILLAFSDEELNDMYSGVDLRVEGHDEPRDLEVLKRYVAEERERGYVAGSFVPGIAHVAAPVRDASGRAVAGVNVSDYESLPCMQDMHGVLKDEVLATSAEISSRLGHSGHTLRATPPESKRS